MMFSKYLLMSFFAFAGGVMVSGGVFTVLIAVGLIPRFADKSHTSNRIFLYEEMVVLGTITGSFLSVYPDYGQIGIFFKDILKVHPSAWNLAGNGILAFAGMFAGMFVGCLALAIAEMIDTIPIFTRRINFKKGLGIVVTCVAVGKMIGSLLYFSGGFYVSGY